MTIETRDAELNEARKEAEKARQDAIAIQSQNDLRKRGVKTRLYEAHERYEFWSNKVAFLVNVKLS